MKKKSSTRVVEPHWRQVELPVLADTLCTGCGWCVDACPTECLALGAHVAWLPRPLDCVSCGLCAAICPANAIEMQSPPRT
jgi:formate hydrogenlyase subunit 6/NADH:ubiquinone oxidoreductase subunit I